MRTTAMDEGIDPQLRDDCAHLAEILRRFVAKSWGLLDVTSPRASRELAAEVRADRVRLVVEFDVRYPGAIELVALNNAGERYAVTRLSLDRADPNFLRVIVPTDDASATDNVVLN
jgi:hypothetical protein